MRLIDADALIEDLNKKSSYDLVCFDIELLGIITDQPTIEVGVSRKEQICKRIVFTST